MNQELVFLRDIQPPLPLPEEPVYMVYFLAIVAIILIAALVYWLFRRKNKAVRFPAAHETALAALSRARQTMSVEQGVQYATDVSGILRKYIEERFCIQASRQTTREFFDSITERTDRGTDIFSREHRSRLKECLRECDMAKFARCTPDIQSMEKMESAVRDFIEETHGYREGGK